MNFTYKSFKFRNYHLYLPLLFLATVLIFSCGESKRGKGNDSESPFVINELMAVNQTRLLASDGQPYDWIEIKNVSKESASLEDYSLVLEKTENGKLEQKQWFFPAVDVKGGGYVVVFASKKDGSGLKGLHADFRLPSSGGKLQLLDDDGAMVSEVEYERLGDDECLRRVDSVTYEKSYECSPGYANSRKGFMQYCAASERHEKAGLRLWEVHPKGIKKGNAWIELKNTSDHDINLEGYHLATSMKHPDKWKFPSVSLKPGDTYVVDCKKDHFKPGSNPSIILSRDGKFVDGICTSDAPYGTSTGRTDGEPGLFFFPTPTRGSENSGSRFRFLSSKPTFSPSAGVYAKDDTIVVRLQPCIGTVRYTTDGSRPTSSSPEFNDSLTLSKSTTLRAYCEGDSLSMQSPVGTYTFIFDNKHDIPVFNITVNKSDLYDYSHGIYERGPGAEKEFPHMGANYWKSWWKQAHIEFFDDKGKGFSDHCELGIFGGFSRALPKKSFKIRFRDYLGQSSIRYDLYADGRTEKYKNFILRSGSQDIGGVMVRDEFFTSLMAPHCPHLLIQPYRPCALYVNGEYFGLYYIREKIDKHFVARHLGVSSDSVSILMSGMYCEEGSSKDYDELMAYVKSHDMSKKEHLAYAEKKIDFEGLIDFKLGEIYAINTDVGNVRYVRSTDRLSDKRWHIVYYDLDATWVGDKTASYYLVANGGTGPGSVSVHNMIIFQLLKNKEFRKQFMERLSYHMHHTFTPENTTAVFDSLVNRIKPEMEYNCERWKNVLSYSSWERNVATFRKKFEHRSKDMLNDLRKTLSITSEEEKKYFSDLGF